MSASKSKPAGNVTNTNNSCFELDAKEVFERAGVDPKVSPELSHEVISCLSSKMASLSVRLGLSWERVRLYKEQKEALVQDLIARTSKPHNRADPGSE